MIKYCFLLLLTGLCSCGIYRQNVVNAPLLQQKGQAQVSAHISFNGLEGQAAYALTEKTALLANYQNMGRKIENNNNYANRHTFKEMGFGLFKKTETGTIREAFILAGTGSTERTGMKRDSAGNLSSRKVNYNRFALQADFGNTKKKLRYALSPRLVGVHYYKIADNTRKDYRNISNVHFFAEGAITLRYPILSFLMLSGQACVTLPFTHPRESNYYYEFSPTHVSIGLLFNKDLLKPKKEKR